MARLDEVPPGARPGRVVHRVIRLEETALGSNRTGIVFPIGARVIVAPGQASTYIPIPRKDIIPRAELSRRDIAGSDAAASVRRRRLHRPVGEDGTPARRVAPGCSLQRPAWG